MHPVSYDDQARFGHHDEFPTRIDTIGDRRVDWCSGSVVLLHFATCPFWVGRKWGLDREFHAACALSTIVHCSDDCLPRLWVLAGLPFAGRYNYDCHDGTDQ